MVYQWKPGTRLSADPQAVGERLEVLQARHGDALTAEQVVEDARDESSPLHPCFEWDDTVAAEEYRKEQARYLLRALIVVSEPEEEGAAEGRPAPEGRAHRAYVVVREEDDDRYVPTVRAMSDEELRNQVLAQALAELRAVQRKYAELRELARVFEAIDAVQLEVLS